MPSIVHIPTFGWTGCDLVGLAWETQGSARSREMLSVLSRRTFLRYAASAAPLLAACTVPGTGGIQKPSGRVTEIMVWLADQNPHARRVFAERIVPAVEARLPHVRMFVEWNRWDTHLDKVAALALETLGPDIFQFGFADVIKVERRNLAEPLDDRTAAWVGWSDFFAPCRRATVWNDTTFGVPSLCAPMTVFWRLDLLEKIGVQSMPTTWEQTVEIGRKAASQDGLDALRQGMNPPTVNETLMLFRSIGGRPVVIDGRTQLNSAEGRETLRYQRARWNAGGAGDGADESAPPVGSPLVSGYRLGQYANLPSILVPFLSSAPDLLDTLGVGAPPVPGGTDFKPMQPGLATPVVETFTDSLAVARYSSRPDIAWEVAKTLASPDLLLAYSESLFLTPVRRSATGRGFTLKYGHARLVEYLDRWGEAAPRIPLGRQYRAAIQSRLPQVLEGSLDIDKALAEIEGEQNQLLASVGFSGSSS